MGNADQMNAIRTMYAEVMESLTNLFVMQEPVLFVQTTWGNASAKGMSVLSLILSIMAKKAKIIITLK